MARECRQQDRKQRVPLGVPRRKLSTDERPGFVRRWVNDKAGRLQQAEEGGYQYVTSAVVGDVPGDVTEQANTGTRVSRVVGADDGGRPVTAYLMEIPKEWYDEDQSRKMEEIDKVEDSLRRGADDNGKPGADGRYIPSSGIKIEQRTS